MGLCDDERLNGMFYAVKALNEQLYFWKNDYKNDDKKKYQSLQDLIGQSWHAFLGDTTNALHWFMGSSSGNTITTDSPRTPWEMAITQNLDKVLNKVKGHKDNQPFEWKENTEFNALESVNIPALLAFDNVADSHVFRIYTWVEQLSYYLRRYDDEFLHRFQKLNSLISNLMGESYVIFSQNENFTKAYVIRETMKLLYGDEFYHYHKDKWDVVTQLLEEHNFCYCFYNFIKYSAKIEDIARIHIDLATVETLAKKSTPKGKHFSENLDLLKLRCITMLNIGKSIYENDKAKQSCLTALASSPLSPFMKEFHAIIAKNQIAYNELKKDESDDSFLLKGLNCYGTDGYFHLYKELEKITKEKVLVPKKKVALKKKVISKKKVIKKS